ALAQENSSILLEVGNDFCEVWLKENYLGLLKDVIAVSSGRQLDVKFKVGPSRATVEAPATAAPAPKSKTTEASEKSAAAHELNFNPKYTFDSFVVGNNNN